jgi:protein SCO1/2
MKTNLKPANHRRLAIVLAAVLTAFSTLAAERPLPPGGDFTLQGKQGRVSLSDFRGKIVVMYFGYLTCADICPTSMSLIAGALRQLSPAERNRIAGIFITVDPERDNAQTTANYASQFDSSFTGLSGDLPAIREVAARYGAQFKKVPVRSAMGYAVDHSSATCIIDANGRLVRVLKHGTGTRDILEALRAELRK